MARRRHAREGEAPQSHGGAVHVDATQGRLLPCEAAAVLMEASARVGSRHVAAATAAALYHLLVDGVAGNSSGDVVLEEELKERMAAVAHPLRAQLHKAREGGHNVHNARGLVSNDDILRRNAALHVTDSFRVAPFSALTVRELRCSQRSRKAGRLATP